MKGSKRVMKRIIMTIHVKGGGRETEKDEFVVSLSLEYIDAGT